MPQLSPVPFRLLPQAWHSDSRRASQTLELGRERGALEPEHPGSLRLVAAGLAERLRQNSPLHVGYVLFEVEPFVRQGNGGQRDGGDVLQLRLRGKRKIRGIESL